MEKDKRIMLLAGAGLAAILLAKLAVARPVEVRKGDRINAIVTFKNTGQEDWNFGVVFMIRDSAGKIFYCGENISLMPYVNPYFLAAGGEISYAISNLAIPQEISLGNCDIKAEIWQENVLPLTNLLDSTAWIANQLKIIE